MSYLTIDPERIRVAWESVPQDRVDPLADISEAEQLHYGRRAAVVHVPQSYPKGWYCHNCGARYPCRLALWGVGVLKARGWDVADVLDLIESVQAGDPL